MAVRENACLKVRKIRSVLLAAPNKFIPEFLAFKL